MRPPRMPTRPTMIAVVVLTLIPLEILAINELIRRAEHFHVEAEYHRVKEERLRAEAVELESLVSDPSRESELPFALFQRERWSRRQALEMELESAVPFCRTESIDPMLPRSRLWNKLASEAKRVANQEAQTCRRMSDYHARQRRRYERIAYSPWLHLDSDQPTPES